MGGTVTTVNGSTPTVTGTTNTAETATLSGLTPNTEYFFQIKAVNSVTTTYGAVLNFTTTLAPTATTSAASGTTATTSTLNGSVNAENSSTTVSFCYSTSSPTNCSGATTVSASPATATGTSNTSESAALSGLTPGTEYFFQIEATNSVGTTYGSVLNFTTPAAAPTATTNAATSVSGTGSDPQRLGQRRGGLDNGHLLLQHVDSLTNCVGGTVTTVNGSTPTVTGNTNTAETATLTGLTPNTEYFFQIKAVNSVTTTYGAVLNFTTSLAPTATTSAASGTTATTSTLNGSVNAENASTTVNFCYSTSSRDELLGRHHRRRPARPRRRAPRTPPRAPRSSGLTPGTEYYFQIEATNSVGTTYGSVLNFTTLGGGPTATTNAATSVTRHGSDPQRLGQRRGGLDHGHLLLQHLELAEPTAWAGPSPP